MKDALAFVSLLAVAQAHVLFPVGPNGAVDPRKGVLNPHSFFAGPPFGQVPVFVITQSGSPNGFPGAFPGVPGDGKKCDDKPGDGGSKPGNGEGPEERKGGEEPPPTPETETKPTEEPATTEEPKPDEAGEGKEAETPKTEGQETPDKDDSSEEDKGVENRAGKPAKPAGPGGPADPALPVFPTFQFVPVFNGHPFVPTVLAGPLPHGALPQGPLPFPPPPQAPQPPGSQAPGAQPPAEQPPAVDKMAGGAPKDDGKPLVYGYFIPASGPVAPFSYPGVFGKPGHTFF